MSNQKQPTAEQWNMAVAGGLRGLGQLWDMGLVEVEQVLAECTRFEQRTTEQGFTLPAETAQMLESLRSSARRAQGVTPAA